MNFSQTTKRQRQSVIWSSVIGVCILAIIAILLSTGGWYRSYSNKRYGIRIKYPSNWKVKENSGGAIVIFISPKANALDLFQENVNITIYDMSAKPMDLKKFSEKAMKQVLGVFRRTVKAEESRPMSLSGRPGYRFVFSDHGETPVKLMLTWGVKGNIGYIITYTSSLDDYDKSLKKAEKMVRSFSIE